MTLRDFLQFCTDNPFLIVAFFLLIPSTAFLAGIFGKGEGHYSPWKYLYSILIYLACVPGIFAITLNIYLFLFERGISIMDIDVYTQVLPVFSMIATIFIIRKNVDLDLIPGFEKIGGLLMMITAVLVIMWIFDRTRIWMVTRVPFALALFIFGALLLVIRLGWNKLSGGKAPGSPPEEHKEWFKAEH